jgi:DUF4097 and DUF4098 domain-containing protein YvlB
MNLSLPATLLLLALGSCSITFFGQERASREGSIAHTASSGIHTIRIDGYNGDIDVIPGVGKEIRANTKTYATGSTQAEADKRLGQMQWSFRESGSTLHLELSRPDRGASNAGSDLMRLEIPASWTVDVDTSNGDVDVANGFQTILVHSSNGDLDIQSNGKVRLRTSNGDIDFGGSSQDFQMTSSNGDIILWLDGDWSGDGNAHSSNGKISLRCDGLLDCTLRGSTSNGKLNVYGPSLDSGTGTLVLGTSNSGISVTHGNK